MFVLSKIVGFLIAPLNFVLFLFALAALGRWRGWWRLARFSNRLALLTVGVIVLTPLPEIALRALEDRHPIPRDVDLAEVAGVIMLGGAQDDGNLAAERGTYLLNANAERLTEVLALRVRRPDLPVIASGGSGRVVAQSWSEPEINRAFFRAMGVDPDSIIAEDTSRNTHENARFTAALIPAEEERPWLLLTSAAHMPRSVEMFRAEGVRVIPWPVDFKAPPPSWHPAQIYAPRRFGLAALALREWVGIWYFRLFQRA